MSLFYILPRLPLFYLSIIDIPSITISHVFRTSRGLGLEFVRQIVAAGNTVFATCRSPDTATKLQQLASANPDKIHIVPLDVSSHDSVKEAAVAVGKLLGDAPLDFLMNNAALVSTPFIRFRRPRRSTAGRTRGA